MKKIISIIFLLFLSSNAFAASDDEVKVFVNDIGNKIVEIANKKNLSDKKKEEEIITVIDGVIDANWIARFVLSKNYKTATEPQKQRFTKLYREFMINTYGPKFKRYNGRKFEVVEVKQQSSFYIAKSSFLPRDSNVEISVDFRVKEKDNKLVILDFVAEGVSLIETQRSEFNSAISQKGMDKFLDDLEVRVNDLRNR